MKHSQKVALVPYNQVISQQPTQSVPNADISHEQAGTNQSFNDQHPTCTPTPTCNIQHPTCTPTSSLPRDILKDRLTELDTKMKMIVQDTLLSAEEKVIRYNMVLDQYLLFADKYYNREHHIIPHLKPSSFNESPDRDLMSERDKHIISSLPQSYQKKGDILLKYLRDAGTSWSEDGIVVDNGHEIQGSNIKELVHFVLRHRRKNALEPKGIDHFERLLKSSNLPEEIVPWNKVFDRKRNKSPDEQIHEQHGSGNIKRWSRY